MIVSLILPWPRAASIRVISRWLSCGIAAPTSSLSLLILLIPLAVVLVIGAFVPMGAAVRLSALSARLSSRVCSLISPYRHGRRIGRRSRRRARHRFLPRGHWRIVAFVSGLIPSGWRTRRVVTRSVPNEGTVA